jgi:hypothetical protein
MYSARIQLVNWKTSRFKMNKLDNLKDKTEKDQKIAYT